MSARRSCAALLGITALTVCACVGASNVHAATSTTAVDPEQRLYAPEVWRLPPVEQPVVPPALAVTPAEMVCDPSASDEPPASNAPLSLSGILSNGSRLASNLEAERPKRLWEGAFDLGVDGAEGNSETFNLHAGFHANRKAANNTLTVNLDYNKATAKTVNTTNRAFFDGRFERLIGESRWSWFVHETAEYDEFQSFNVRDSSDAGIGYRLIKDENGTLIGRVGSGFSHTFGGPEDGHYTPEAVFGLQLERQLSRRQKIYGVVEHAPDLTGFARFRMRVQAAWELLLDEEKNLSLRMGVLDLYDSDPNGARPNDVDYALTLLWKF
ncbi:MAG: DUF481 domain-containing protein [Planctomycetaceae bacterium]|nr:DUF481 domain-containing protein [Planctomycetaceae bacterium]